MNRVSNEINLRCERMPTGAERFSADYSKKPSGTAMEGTFDSGGGWWDMVERCRDSKEWVGIREVVGWSPVEDCWDENEHDTLIRKDLEKAGQRREVPSSLKRIVSFCCFAYDMFTECVFFLQLDTEYRYWSFMEAHPAHNSLPANAKMEAMESLYLLTCALCLNFHFFLL